MKSLAHSIVLLVTFIVAFFITTAFFDTIERSAGYYNQGINERLK